MQNPYFIMIHNQRDTAVLPLMCGEEVAMFATIEEATEAAHENDYAMACGWDLFEAGCGTESSHVNHRHETQATAEKDLHH